MTAYQVYPKSTKKVWWKCQKCGHEWQAVIASRAKGTKCPLCSGHIVPGKNDFTTVYPKLLEEWDYEKNDIDPQARRIRRWDMKILRRNASLIWINRPRPFLPERSYSNRRPENMFVPSAEQSTIRPSAIPNTASLQARNSRTCPPTGNAPAAVRQKTSSIPHKRHGTQKL